MMVIARGQRDAALIAGAQDLLKTELNLKEISFSSDETQYVNLSVKPNLKVLGKRLGKDLNTFKSHLEQMNQEPIKVAELLAALEMGRKVQVLGHDLVLEDVLVDRGPKDERLIATSQGITVLLDTRLTEELIFEGLAREVINRIQNFRKDSGFQVTDRIRIEVLAKGELRQAVNLFSSYIAQETLGESLVLCEKTQADFVSEFDVGEDKLSIGISRV
jgi:isoleucyl-tRNA synthetase